MAVLRGIPILAACAGLLTLAAASSALGQRFDARTDRLRGLTPKELARIEPELSRGPVLLVEFANSKQDQLPAINIAVEVKAPAARLAALVTDPERYPTFMKTLDQVTLGQRNGPTQDYQWAWDMGPVQLAGRNIMTRYDPPPTRPQAGYRITIDSDGGDLGTGRFLVRIRPRGPHASVLVLSSRLDLRNANYIARQVARAARSLNRSANMSLAYSMALSFRREAERRAGTGRATDPGRATSLTRPQLDRGRLLPLLRRGDLMLVSMQGDRLDRVAVFGYVGQPHRLVREIMLDAKAFGSSLVPGSKATVVSAQGESIVFDWTIDVPVVGVAGRMHMRAGNPEIAIQATEGALRGGRWHFETEALGREATLLRGWARFDFSNSTWLLEALLSSDPYLGQGMTVASEVMLLRAIRSRARKRAKAQQGAAGPQGLSLAGPR